MNLLNDLRVPLALWIGGPTVRLWMVRFYSRVLDEGFLTIDPERGEREAFTRKPPAPQQGSANA